MVRALRSRGFPHAERRALAGTNDLGDIVGTPGIVWEVKGGEAAKTASDGLIDEWLAETDTERVNARADVGVLVVQRRSVGAPNAHRWWALLPLEVLARLTFFGRSAAMFHNHDCPVRMLLHDVCHVLVMAGYGEQLAVVTEIPASEVTVA